MVASIPSHLLPACGPYAGCLPARPPAHPPARLPACLSACLQLASIQALRGLRCDSVADVAVREDGRGTFKMQISTHAVQHALHQARYGCMEHEAGYFLNAAVAHVWQVLHVCCGPASLSTTLSFP